MCLATRLAQNTTEWSGRKCCCSYQSFRGSTFLSEGDCAIQGHWMRRRSADPKKWQQGPHAELSVVRTFHGKSRLKTMGRSQDLIRTGHITSWGWDALAFYPLLTGTHFAYDHTKTVCKYMVPHRRGYREPKSASSMIRNISKFRRSTFGLSARLSTQSSQYQPSRRSGWASTQ